jgi:hypothetical protein
MKYLCARYAAFSAIFFLLVFSIAAPLAQADSTVTGPITQINLGLSRITLATAAGPLTLSVRPSTLITKDRADAALKNLRMGESVRALVYLDPTSQAIIALRLEAQSVGKRRQFKGTLQGFAGAPGVLVLGLKAKPKDPMLIKVDGSTVYLRNNFPADPAEMEIGDQLTIIALTQPDGSYLANQVEATTYKGNDIVIVTGVVKSVVGNTVWVRTWKPNVVELLILNTPNGIGKDNLPMSIESLVRGDQVTAFGARNASGAVETFRIAVNPPNIEFNGTITALNTSEGWIVVTPTEGTSAIKLLVSPATILQVNGSDAWVEDLWLGDRIAIRANTQNEGPWNASSLTVVRIP